MNQLDLMQKFLLALPQVRDWIEQTLERHRPNATPVISFAFPRLSSVYPHDLLARAKAVVVPGKVPFPPLSRLGLPEFSELENMQTTGITFNDTFFVHHRHQSESLHFHELVHVIQWEILGVDNFLIAYGAGILQFGYRDSPMEKMAYSLQDRFDSGSLSMDTVDIVRQQTDAIWRSVSDFISTG